VLQLSQRKFIPRLALCALAVTIGLVLALQGYSKKTEVQSKNNRTIPPFHSKIASIEVISTKIINENTPAAGVSVEVRNNTNKAVMAIDLVCGDGAVTKNGLTDEDKPIVVIPPFGTTTLEMTFSEMTVGAPLVVSAVTYNDGTEEGDEKSLRIMHKVRERDRSDIRAQKKKAGGAK
jgi:hypothetical protein